MCAVIEVAIKQEAVKKEGIPRQPRHCRLMAHLSNCRLEDVSKDKGREKKGTDQ